MRVGHREDRSRRGRPAGCTRSRRGRAEPARSRRRTRARQTPMTSSAVRRAPTAARGRRTSRRSAFEPVGERVDDPPRAASVESSAQRPASDGVTVNDTNSEVSVAMMTTMPNSRKNETDRARHERDRQEHDDVDERDDDRRDADLGPAGDRRSCRRLAARRMPLDILQHDDRVVDEDADDQRHRRAARPCRA